jgi:hypothetical protein
MKASRWLQIFCLKNCQKLPKLAVSQQNKTYVVTLCSIPVYTCYHGDLKVTFEALFSYHVSTRGSRLILLYKQLHALHIIL